MLEDGVYDAIVVDAEGDAAAVRLDVTILTGPHKGEVVSVRAQGLGVDSLDCLGMPATLTVADGEPSIVLDQ